MVIGALAAAMVAQIDGAVFTAQICGCDRIPAARQRSKLAGDSKSCEI